MPEKALRAIAKAFDVTPDFLLQDDGDLPEQMDARLEEVRTKRRADVRDAATRAPGLVDPQALKEISRILDNEHSGGGPVPVAASTDRKGQPVMANEQSRRVADRNADDLK